MLGEFMLKKTNRDVLMKSLDTSMLRQRVISNNIANVTTPEFRRVEVSFEEELRRALDKSHLRGSRTDGDHMDFGRKRIQAVSPEAYHPSDPTLPGAVNNVDIDMEMAKLAENQIHFNYASKFLKGIYTKLNSAISARALPQS